ncbi:MAG: hypothetical protein NC123_02810 [Butyrivibrio sp.]|nr:hypothetical protein [Acetatifactor muris]MCM1558472.1 hypothetical protein [Butyrivibrio sp.]
MREIKRGSRIAAVVWLFAVFLGLWFAGVFSPAAKEEPETEEISQSRIQNWEIVFSGMKFTIPQKGKALVHASGCLNIRQNERYLIQITAGDGTVDEMWEGMEAKQESLTEVGYRMEKEGERLQEGGRNLIRYVISMEGERGSVYDRSYTQVVLAPADEGRHLLAVIWYDGVDVDALDAGERSGVYDDGLAAAEAILSTAQPTDEPDDEAGSGWMEDVSLEPYSSEDTIVYGDGRYQISYRVPEGWILTGDDIAGKNYLNEDNRVNIRANVLKYTWLSAKDMAEGGAEGQLSRIHAAGETVVNGRTFYWYSYSVREYGKRKSTIHYYFYGYCDLEDGSIYGISGYGDDVPELLEETYYLDWMNFSFFHNGN